MHQRGLHITTNYHIIKWWIQSRKGMPAIIPIKRNKFPTVIFKDIKNHHAHPVSWNEFFDTMTSHELAFIYETDNENMNEGLFFKFVPWENYIDEIRDEEKKEDREMVGQTVFS
jgi:hypothetical protein